MALSRDNTARRLSFVLAFLVAGLLIWVKPPNVAEAQEAPTVDLIHVQDVIRREIAKIIEETGIPSISIALVRDGDVVWADAFGYSNVRARVPATAATYYSTGSTFKFVTATAIMQLAEQGKLSLDDPVNKFLDHPIAGAGDVKLRHMLSHHSGLQGPVNTVPLWGREAPMTPAQLAARTERMGEPGVEYRYCNECYAILGHVIAKLSGLPYDEYVAEHILAPLGIEGVVPSVPSPAVVELLALPYRLENNEPEPVGQVRYDVFAAGDVYLRAADMARFLAAQLGGGAFQGRRLLDPASVEEMRRPQFDGSDYGLGTGTGEQDGHALISHSGAIPGFNSISVGDVDAGVGAYVMGNAAGAGRALGPLARLSIRLLRGEAVEPLPSFASVVRVEIALPDAVFDGYVGKYELEEGATLSISREGDRFYVELSGQDRVEIFAESQTEFFLRVVNAQITFGSDTEGGPVTYLVLHQGGADQRAAKIQ